MANDNRMDSSSWISTVLTYYAKVTMASDIAVRGPDVWMRPDRADSCRPAQVRCSRRAGRVKLWASGLPLTRCRRTRC